MKKHLLSLSGLLMLFSVSQLQAQSIPNGGFETWVSAPTYEAPVITPSPVLNTSNDESLYRSGGNATLTMTKIAGVSGNAVRLENKDAGNGEVYSSFISFGNTDNGTFSKGIPLPGGYGLSGLSMYIRYSVSASTPGFVGLIPMKNGSPVGPGNGVFPGAYIYPLSGSVPTFTLTNYTFSPALAMNPDSCVVFITAADVINNGVTLGDFVEIDELNWIGNPNPFYGGNLDTWQNKPSLLVPDQWNVNYGGQDKTFAQSADAKSGSYSLEIYNITTQQGVNSGQAMLGHYQCISQNNCIQKPGMKLLGTPSSFVFYSKYSTPGADNGQCYLAFFKNGTQVGQTNLQINPSSAWTYQYIQVPVLSQAPDSVFISFEAGQWPNPVNGSSLKIDGLKFNYCDDAAPIEGPVSVCAGSNGVEYSISEEFASGFSWSTSVGTINGSSTGNSVIIDDITANTTISVVKTYADGCPNQTFNLSVSTVSASSTDAGTGGTYCANNAVIALSGTVTGATGVVWSGGTGTFDDNTSLMAHYTPGVADLMAGTVTLTLTPTGTGGCSVASDIVTYNFTAAPTADAGPATITKCSNNAVTSLSGSKTGASGVLWSTLGTGTFSSTTSLTPTYTPTVNDTQAGSVKLVISTTGQGNCNPARDTVTLNFTAAPTVYAGADQTICNDVTATLAGVFTTTSGIHWSTSGTGTFDDNTAVGAVYSPSVVDKASGSVTLTITSDPYGTCLTVTDAMTLTINVCTGVTMAGVQEAATVYPNPATSQVTIALGQDVQVSQVDVMNASQYKVKQVQVNALVDQYNLSLDGLEAGMYTIIVRTDAGVVVKKVIKQ